MSSISFEQVTKIYTTAGVDNTVIDCVDLEIESGEFTVFVGPSGCGKSTMLRMVAGLEDITTGCIKFDGKIVNELEPSQRGIGMVFQSYALYPHMTVAGNIAFPLKMSGCDPAGIRTQVREVAEMLEIENLLESKPGQLSGGQRQRVAIGRALVRRPKVFLLDEPLSNLDAALRGRMRLSLSEYHKKLGCTMIYVTHDQTEAMTLADKVVVLRDGIIEQVGSPRELYETPATRFVAEFIGAPRMNMIPATFVGVVDGYANVRVGGKTFLVAVEIEQIRLEEGQSVTLGLRPEHLRIGTGGGLPASVIELEYMGSESLLYAKIDDSEEPVLVRCRADQTHSDNASIDIEFDKDACYLFGPDQRAIPR